MARQFCKSKGFAELFLKTPVELLTCMVDRHHATLRKE